MVQNGAIILCKQPVGNVVLWMSHGTINFLNLGIWGHDTIYPEGDVPTARVENVSCMFMRYKNSMYNCSITYSRDVNVLCKPQELKLYMYASTCVYTCMHIHIWARLKSNISKNGNLNREKGDQHWPWEFGGNYMFTCNYPIFKHTPFHIYIYIIICICTTIYI